MATILSVKAVKLSTYVVTATITDEDGQASVPTALAWTLTDLHGDVVNNRDGVAITSPASTVEIVLSGADLAVSDPTNVRRKVTLVGTYNSSLGTNLPIVAEAEFDIEDAAGAP